MSFSGPAIVLHGSPVRDSILSGVRERLSAAGSPEVTLATVLVGDDGPSRRYVRSKQQAAQQVGVARVRDLAADDSVHGVLVQMPLPGALDAEEVLAAIPPDKDVDGLTAESLGRLVRGVPGHVGCTALGVLRILEHHGIATAGREAVVVGRSTLVGLPLSLLLARKGVDCTVTVAHSRTTDLAAVCRRADILVSATGVARSIGVDHVKPGAAVIDVGISRDESGIVGDVDADPVSHVAGSLTPMPGGTGLVTVACLIENTLEAARMQGVAIPERTSR